MMINSRSTMLLLLTVMTTACGPRLPHADEEDGSTPEDLPPVTDLPCGGADLMTDNDNCGVCGNVCPLSLVGTPWEAGSCVDGECGPNWSPGIGVQDPPLETCVDVCATFDQTCVSGGCAGLAGLMLEEPWFDPPVDLSTLESRQIETCDEELVFVSDDETHSVVRCCCAKP